MSPLSMLKPPGPALSLSAAPRIFFSSTLSLWLPYSRMGLALRARSTLAASSNTMNPKLGTCCKEKIEVTFKNYFHEDFFVLFLRKFLAEDERTLKVKLNKILTNPVFPSRPLAAVSRPCFWLILTSSTRPNFEKRSLRSSSVQP